MSPQEWLDRYEARFVARGVEPTVAAHARVADDFAVLSEDYEDDPEGAADLEMCYWDFESMPGWRGGSSI